MSMTDPVADMLTRIRNGILRKYDSVDIPASRLKLELAKLFEGEGFIQGHQIIDQKGHRILRIHLKYMNQDQPVITGLRRISKPGRRVYVGKDEIPSVRGGVGTAVLSTSQGVMTDRESKKRNVGGELLCYIW
jgi:small subunit ribosomal protein S8